MGETSTCIAGGGNETPLATLVDVNKEVVLDASELLTLFTSLTRFDIFPADCRFGAVLGTVDAVREIASVVSGLVFRSCDSKVIFPTDAHAPSFCVLFITVLLPKL